jgi:hypothetical protein
MTLESLAVEQVADPDGRVRFRTKTVPKPMKGTTRGCTEAAISHAIGRPIRNSDVVAARSKKSEKKKGKMANDTSIGEVATHLLRLKSPFSFVEVAHWKGAKGLWDLLNGQGGIYILLARTSWEAEDGEIKHSSHVLCLDTWRRYIFNNCHHKDFQCDIYDEKDLALGAKSVKKALKDRHNIDEIAKVFVVMVDTNRLTEVNHI